MLTRDWLYRNLVQQGGRRSFSEPEALIDLEWHARWSNRNLSLDGIDFAVPRGAGLIDDVRIYGEAIEP